MNRDGSRKCFHVLPTASPEYVIKPFNTEEPIARLESHLEIKSERETIISQKYDIECQNTNRRELALYYCRDLLNPFHNMHSIMELAIQDLHSTR